MARLEQLISDVADEALRRDIETEIAALKDRTKFGLVYERHLPETALIADPDVLRVGDRVRTKQTVDTEANCRIVSIDGQTATIVPDGNGKKTKVAISDLFVVKPFEEPIYPTLRPLEAVERSESRPYHAVIDGENFHALQLLTFLYAHRVDCIYIDPPYNSGATDWKYNNRYVDAADRYRHSKWLSMMEKRLRLAKGLLKPDGVLIVTVDENEVHHLGVLLEEVFPDYARHMITIVISAQGNDKANFSRVDEYAYFCVPGDKELIEGAPIDLLPPHDEIDVNLDDEDTDDDAATDEHEPDHYLLDETPGIVYVRENARRRGTESLRKDRTSMFFPIFIDEDEERIVRVGEPIPLDEEPTFDIVGGLRPIWPIDKKGDHRRWRWGHERMAQLIEKGELQLGQHNKKHDTWTINRLEPKLVDKPDAKKLKTVWRHTSHSAGSHGSGLLQKILGRSVAFSFPKSLYAVRDCLAAVCRSRPDALIVDFFAGSGTTLHATLLMNAADGGRRKCFLVTNNELDPKATLALNKKGLYRSDPDFETQGIFEAVAMPRCKAAVTGLRPDGEPIDGLYRDGREMSLGFDENVEFFRLDYLDADTVELGQRFDAIHPLLWLQAGGRGARPSKVDPRKPFHIAESSGYAILFDVGALPELADGLDEREDITHVFVVTDSVDAFAEARERVGPGRETFMLYREYLQNFRTNAPSNV